MGKKCLQNNYMMAEKGLSKEDIINSLNVAVKPTNGWAKKNWDFTKRTFASFIHHSYKVWNCLSVFANFCWKIRCSWNNMKYWHDLNKGENTRIYHVLRGYFVWCLSVRLTQHLLWKHKMSISLERQYIERTAHMQIGWTSKIFLIKFRIPCLTFPLKYIRTGKAEHTHVESFSPNKSNWIESHAKHIDCLHELCILISVPIEFIDSFGIANSPTQVGTREWRERSKYWIIPRLFINANFSLNFCINSQKLRQDTSNNYKLYIITKQNIEPLQLLWPWHLRKSFSKTCQF